MSLKYELSLSPLITSHFFTPLLPTLFSPSPILPLSLTLIRTFQKHKMQSAKIAVAQFCGGPSVSTNLSKCTHLMRMASSQGAKLVFFPEASDFIGNPPEEALILASPINDSTKEVEGEFLKGICKEARNLGIGCSIGVHEQVCFFFFFF